MKTLHTPKTAAVEIRKILKANFPKTKFSVRTEHFSMGNAIDIRWELGPTTEQVDALTGKFEYGRFDGMTDYSYSEHTEVEVDGEKMRLGGAKYVTSHRDFPEDFRQKVIRQAGMLAAKRLGESYPKDKWSIEEYANRALYGADLSNGYHGIRVANKNDGSRSGREPFIAF